MSNALLPAERLLSGGSTARIEADTLVHGAVQLLLDGTPQSHVNSDDPTDLFFEYVRRMGHVIDIYRDPGAPITALHLGGGAFTLPRYVEATRPGSQQQVIEINGDLVDFVREYIPLPKRASIRVRRGDAREKLSSLPKGLHGRVDLIVVDVFSGAQTPAHLTSVEFYEEMRPLLAPGGIVLVNSADGQGQRFTRGQAATLQRVFGSVVALGEPQVLKGRRFGNVVLATGLTDPFPLHRLMTAGPHPASLLEGDALLKYTARAKPVLDATAVHSPAPPESVFGGSS